MTAAELIQRLSNLDPATEVIWVDHLGHGTKAEREEQLELLREHNPDKVYMVLSNEHPFVIDGQTYYQ
jgi:hypothetical protein